MDSTTGLQSGQQNMLRATAQSEIQELCELVQFLRAWWDASQATIRQLDRAASSKAHDAFVEAVALARRIARDLGITLPDFSAFDWSASAPPAGHAAITDI